MTNQFVFAYGEIVDDWPCDTNPVTGETEVNGGVEHLVRYGENDYLIITDWDGIKIFRATEEAIPTHGGNDG